MGNIILSQIFTPTTQSNRTLRIYLPEGYELSDERYPVLYMHDGQNLFFDSLAYGGNSWGIKDTLDQLILQKVIPKVIVVGIDNSSERVFEYAPWHASEFVKKKTYFQMGGKGDAYATFVVTSLKPMIDQTYRTKTDYQNTLIAGSSLGAYISAYIGAKYPNVFSKIGVFSLASWFNEDDFLSYISQSSLPSDQKYFITIGTKESSFDDVKEFPDIYLKNSQNLKALLVKKGISNIYYQETDDFHNEQNWKKAFPIFIKFMFKD